ncbi:hypothetical protein E6C70_00475 [Glaciibacter flavus]|uniref:Glycosyltransferase RgtA/B/C/D-like domain-containing protein n=1 Tax=Orlajensenia flava TaxID=2565934 RepID=A0A4V3WUJ1_9MICO|nr:hypothetical protein [Glaciibacter flavus]THG36057.1 hypothetical protein E6C70_00475 [Glaciibacter flavus]
MPTLNKTVRSVADRYRKATTPRPDGLPRRRVVLLPLLALAAVLAILVGLGITGSSTGYLNQFVSNGADSRLIAGKPQSIRSDEWFVQSTWTVSQVEQGLPPRNTSFPGGMDATVQHDLPTLDWSMVFHPHLWGFLLMPIDNAMALKWWLPAFAMIAAIYLFVVTMLPRRPALAAVLAIGFFFAPFFQWWYLSITFLPVAWAFLLMATVIWLIRSGKRAERYVLSGLVGYGAIVVGTSIYAPFIIAATWPAVGFAVGFVLTRTSGLITGFWQRLKRLTPLAVAGGATLLGLGLWLMTRWSTIESFTSTVYPGQRLQAVGQATRADLYSIMGGVFSPGLGAVNGVPMGVNASEGSTFLLPGAFLVLPLVWLVVSGIRRRRSVDWLSIVLLGLGVVFVAYLFVPGWDALSHLMLLDRTTTGRLRLGLGILSLLMVVVLVVRLNERRDEDVEPKRLPVWIIVMAPLTALGANLIVARWLHMSGSPLVTQWTVWIVVLVLFVGAVLFLTLGRPLVGGVALLIASLLCGAGVNPVYVGVYNLNDTKLVAALKVVSSHDSEWVGIGDTVVPTVALVESGLHSYNGFQSSPSDDMWSQIDPSGANEVVWNRLANVSWAAGSGAPAPYNPAPDQIHMTFDSCNAFAQHNIDFVLSERALAQPCVDLVRTVQEGPQTFRIYEVTPAR